MAGEIRNGVAPAGSADRCSCALFTDFYELTMAEAYLEEDMTAGAVFGLYVRHLPGRRNFLVACGLDTVLGYLESLRFSGEDIAWLASLGKFSPRFLEWLRDFRFTGDVRAVPEGTPVFAAEPILEVSAPLPQAQLVETFIINQIHLQTVIASKACRVVLAAEGRPVVDFGARRIHGTDAALKAARAFHIAGAAATSNVLAGQRYGVPLAGTMAHSYIQAHEDEASAFSAFARLWPGSVLLVDTYDTLEGVKKVIELAQLMGSRFCVRGVRLDSGDLLELSRAARRLLDEAGLGAVEIIASGGLDEEAISALLEAGAPIDGFGVGTYMGVSNDAPDLDMAYKLCEYAGAGRLKFSAGKPILPGAKQIFRMGNPKEDRHDVIASEGENLPGRPLLSPVMRHGRRLETERPGLDAIRAYARAQVERLPPHIRSLQSAEQPYEVQVSPALCGLQQEVSARIRERAAPRHSETSAYG